MEQGTTKIADLPFSVTFTWKEDAFKISLIDGEDLFKIADLICDIFRTKWNKP